MANVILAPRADSDNRQSYMPPGRALSCPACESDFQVSRFLDHWSQRKFCSKRCYRRSNDQRRGSHSHRARARKYGVQFDRSVSTFRVLERDYWLCMLCMLPIDDGDGTIDHVVPMSRGGAHTWSNVQAAHRSCNSRKGTAVPLSSKGLSS